MTTDADLLREQLDELDAETLRPAWAPTPADWDLAACARDAILNRGDLTVAFDGGWSLIIRRGNARWLWSRSS